MFQERVPKWQGSKPIQRNLESKLIWKLFEGGGGTVFWKIAGRLDFF